MEDEMAKSRAKYKMGTTVIKTHEQLKNTRFVWWYGKPMSTIVLANMQYGLVTRWLEAGMLVEAVLKEVEE